MTHHDLYLNAYGATRLFPRYVYRMIGLPVRAEIVGPGRYGEVRDVANGLLLSDGVEAQFFSESSPGNEFEEKASALLLLIHNTVAK